MLADLSASFIINIPNLTFFHSPGSQHFPRVSDGKQKLSLLIQPDTIRLCRTMPFQICRRRTAVLPVKGPVEAGMCLVAVFQSSVQNALSLSDFIDGPAKSAAVHVLPRRHPHRFGKQMGVMAGRKSRKSAQLLRTDLRFQIILDIIQRLLYAGKRFFHRWNPFFPYEVLQLFIIYHIAVLKTFPELRFS